MDSGTLAAGHEAASLFCAHALRSSSPRGVSPRGLAIPALLPGVAAQLLSLSLLFSDGPLPALQPLPAHAA